MLIKDYSSRIFKPAALSSCKQCQSEGHHASDPACPAHAMPEMAEDVEMFCGSSCELSNLYKCPEGCVIEDQGTTFETSEHHYQFKKL